MQKSDKKQYTWKDTFRMHLKCIRIILSKYPWTLIYRLIDVTLAAIVPYVIIYFSAQIISELAGACRTERLQQLVIVTLGVTLALNLVRHLVARLNEVENHTTFYYLYSVFSDKMLDMDFAQVDSNEVQSEYETIIRTLGGAGWGFHRVIEVATVMTKAIFTLIGGIALTVTLFTSQVPLESIEYQWLNHPLIMVAFLGILILTAVIAPALSTHAEAFWAKHVGDHALGNRRFVFWGYRGYHKEVALDIRIYRQERFSREFAFDKTGTFGTQGIYAKHARGKGGALYAGSATVTCIFTGFVYIFVCLKAWAGAFDVGAVTQYVAAVTAMATGVSDLLAQLGIMRNNTGFLKQALDFLDIPSVMYKGSLTVEKRSDNRYEIEFRDVGFKYPGSDSWALRHVSTKFRVGEKLAVVGQNGSGKTTFIKLLCRLYDPTEGEILLNGIPIHKYNYAEYMDIFSVVFQDFKLLGLPLGENVAGRSQYDRSKAERCLEKAGFADRLKTMPKGLDTTLYKDFDAEGIEISGGEAQKIALARALYKDAPFIVLDEPTAALDPVAEYEIYTRFNEIVGDHTAIYISHRLSSCRFCDRIAVFDGGSIVQDGSHEQLLVDEAGKYAQLWNAQAQYYAEQGIEVGV